MENLYLQNDIVKNWGNKVLRLLKFSTGRFVKGKRGKVIKNNRAEDKLINSFSLKTHKYYDIIDSLSYKFERHGVFVHKGVGRGYRISGGKVIKYSKNHSGHREAEEWFNPVLDDKVPELADKIAEVNTDAAVNATRMKIN